MAEPCGCPAPHEHGVSRRRMLQAGAAAGVGAALAPALRVRTANAASRPAVSFPQLRPTIIAHPDWPVPPIVTRAQWNANEALRTVGPTYDTAVEKIVVHHTVTPNNPSDPAATVRSIYEYHLSTGYIDIAYNYLIDQNGKIYEGRWARDYGSAPHNSEDAQGRPVHAAHATDTNTNSIGVALLGTFSSVTPTDAAIEGLVTLLTWKCARWGIDSQLSNVYVDGRTFPNVAGHRDVTSTQCPGDPFYAMLNDIRQAVAARLGAAEDGYWIATKSGSAFAFGDLPDLGDPRRSGVKAAMQSVVANPAGVGYWVLGADGGIFSYGDAAFYGSTGGMRLNEPIVGMAPKPDGSGYWLVATDGGVFAFGGAVFFGSTGGIRLNKPIVGMAVTPSGNGYWLVASDGGIFAFGDAQFFGSTGAIRLNQPIVAMTPTPSGSGYWLVASDGGVFAFGDALFLGSTGNIRLARPIVSMAATPSGGGYWMLASDGGVFAFGDAPFHGSAVGRTTEAVGLAARLIT